MEGREKFDKTQGVQDLTQGNERLKKWEHTERSVARLCRSLITTAAQPAAFITPGEKGT
jgi:hypothetical protein